jgi:hypothetical protein
MNMDIDEPLVYHLTMYLFQNLVLSPSPIVKKTRSNKSSLTLIIPFQNGESEDFAFTFHKDLECKYLCCMSSSILLAYIRV